MVPDFGNIKRVRAVHDTFRKILGPSTPDNIFWEGRLIFSDDGKRIYENTANHGELSEAVLGRDFPKILDTIELEHYTSITALRKMAVDEKLRLRTVARNLDFDEFRAFATEHGLDGYLAENADGDEICRELSTDLYFLSMVRPGHADESYFWNEFAKGRGGVRLRLRVTPRPPSDLRMIGYQGGSPTAFKQINDELKRVEDLVYTPWGVSRICAFYLTQGYRAEQEVRLLIKRHVDGVDRTVIDGGHRVWPVELMPLGGTAHDPFCGIELVKVDVSPKGTEEAVRSVLGGTPYANVPVSRVPSD